MKWFCAHQLHESRQRHLAAHVRFQQHDELIEEIRRIELRHARRTAARSSRPAPRRTKRSRASTSSSPKYARKRISRSIVSVSYMPEISSAPAGFQPCSRRPPAEVAELARDVTGDVHGARRLAHHIHAIRIAAVRGDVLAHPLHREADVFAAGRPLVLEARADT